MSKETSVVLSDPVEHSLDVAPQRVHRSVSAVSHQLLEFGERQFDRVQVGAIRRQVRQRRDGPLRSRPDEWGHVTGVRRRTNPVLTAELLDRLLADLAVPQHRHDLLFAESLLHHDPFWAAILQNHAGTFSGIRTAPNNEVSGQIGQLLQSPRFLTIYPRPSPCERLGLARGESAICMALKQLKPTFKKDDSRVRPGPVRCRTGANAVASAAAHDRSGPTDLHRRDLGQDEHDASARPSAG